MRFAIEMAVLEGCFLKYRQGILGVRRGYG
jgi:hypothetical protein